MVNSGPIRAHRLDFLKWTSDYTNLQGAIAIMSATTPGTGPVNRTKDPDTARFRHLANGPSRAAWQALVDRLQSDAADAADAADAGEEATVLASASAEQKAKSMSAARGYLTPTLGRLIPIASDGVSTSQAASGHIDANAWGAATPQVEVASSLNAICKKRREGNPRRFPGGRTNH